MNVRKIRYSAVSILLFVFSTSAYSEDRHQGYYYPEPATTESYQGRAPIFSDADKRTRVALVTGLANKLFANPAAPLIAVFPKGGEAEKLIIVALRDGELNSLYRMRAFLAQMTAAARATPLFANAPHPEELTFLDFVASLGFVRLTVTDGKSLAHRIELSATQ